MENLAKIKSQRLKETLKNSQIFYLLTDEQKEEYLSRLMVIPEPEQDNIADQLSEKDEVQKLKALNKILEDLKYLLPKFDKMTSKTNEKIEKSEEVNQMENLLNELNES